MIIGGFAAVVVAAVIVGIRYDWLSLQSLRNVVIRLRDARGTVFVYALLLTGVAAVGLPTTPLLLVGGVLFGLLRGTLISWLAMVAGAAIGYFLAHRVGKKALRRVIERMAGRNVDFSGEQARRTLLRLRLVPFTPYGALTFAAGLAGMRFRDFLTATALGVIPGVAILTYFSSQVLGGAKTATGAIMHTVIAAVVISALSFAPNLWDRLVGRRSERNA